MSATITQLSRRAVLTRLHNATRVVCSALLDDGPHTYIAVVANLLQYGIDLIERPSADMNLLGTFSGARKIAGMMPQDQYRDFAVITLSHAINAVSSKSVKELKEMESRIDSAEAEATRINNDPWPPIELPDGYVASVVDNQHLYTIHDSAGAFVCRFPRSLSKTDLLWCWDVRQYAFDKGVTTGRDKVRDEFRALLGADQPTAV